MERMLARISAEQFNEFTKTYEPLEQELLKKGTDPAKRKVAQGISTADTQQAFADAARKNREANLRAGAGLSSGRSKMGLFSVGGAREQSLAEGRVSSAQNAQELENKFRLRHVAAGRGLADQTTLGMGDVAARDAERARVSAQVAADRNNFIWEGAGTAAGLAFGAHQYNQQNPGSGI
jgi:hypothetical protein